MKGDVELVDRFEFVEALIKADSSLEPNDFILKNFPGFVPMMIRILTAHMVNIRVVAAYQGKQEMLNERFYAAMQDAATMFLNNIDPVHQTKAVVRSESQPARSERMVEMAVPRSVSAPAPQENKANKVPKLEIDNLVGASISIPSSAQVSDRGSVSSNEEPAKPKRVENPNAQRLADLVAMNDQRHMNVAVLKRAPPQPTSNDVYPRVSKIIASMKLFNPNFNKSGRVNSFIYEPTKQNVYSLLLTNYILSHTKNVTQHYAFAVLSAVGKVLNQTLSELFPHNRATLSLTSDEVKIAYKNGKKPVIRLIPQYINKGDSLSYLDCTEELKEFAKMDGYKFSAKNPPIHAFSLNKGSRYVFVVLRDGEVECIEIDEDDDQIYLRALPDVAYELLPIGAGNNEFVSVIGRQLNGL